MRALAVEFSGFSEIKWSTLILSERPFSKKNCHFLCSRLKRCIFESFIDIYLCVVLGDRVDIHFSLPVRKISPLFSILPKSRKSTRFTLNETFYSFWSEWLFFAPGAWTWYPYLNPHSRPVRWFSFIIFLIQQRERMPLTEVYANQWLRWGLKQDMFHFRVSPTCLSSSIILFIITEKKQN